PLVPQLTAPQQLVFTVTATSAASGLSGTATIIVTVNPQSDFVQIINAAYRTKKARLDVAAVDNTPGVTLTMTLDIINQATGLPITVVMGPAIPGGSTSSGVTVLR